MFYSNDIANFSNCTEPSGLYKLFEVTIEATDLIADNILKLKASAFLYSINK